MDLTDKKLIVIVGPTAVGKTKVAITLARHFRTEIVSADSRQFYRELNIGTAKPTDEELRAVPHHFINSHSIRDDFDAAQFAGDALKLIYSLFEKHDHVVVCGGSGLYIRALIEGFDDIPEVSDEIREEITNRYEHHGLDWLQQKMQELDPDYYSSMDQQNPARLMRALEVVMATGKSISTFQTKQKRQLPFKVVKVGLEMDREELYNRIDARMDKMIDDGLFDEVQSLYTFKKHNTLQTVGYTEIFDYMDGQYGREEAIRLLKRNSRRYAKRQLTWFKRDQEIRWFSPNDNKAMVEWITSA